MRRQRILTSALCGVAIVAALLCVGEFAFGGEKAAPKYRSPLCTVRNADGSLLYVSEHTANSVAIVDTKTKERVGEIKVGRKPYGLALSADGKTLYVANEDECSVSAIEVAKKSVKTTIKVGLWPTGLALGKTGTLYVCNRAGHDISVVDTKSAKEVKRFKAIREPVFAALTPQEDVLIVTNALPSGVATNPRLAAEVSLIDVKTGKAIKNIVLPAGCMNVRQVCCSPDGKWAYLASVLGRFNVPTTQLERGWINNCAFTIIDLTKKERLSTMLLDDISQGAANPFGVVCSDDGKFVYVTHSGSRAVSIIDTARLHTVVAETPVEKRDRLTDNLAVMYAKDISRRVLLKQAPMGIVVSPDGQSLYVANYYADTVSVLRSKDAREMATIALGPTPQPDIVRRGEMVFHDARQCFQYWQSCASCHPDARADALNWDLLNDGIGNPKNTKSLLLSNKTPPVMSTGVRDKMESAVRAGFKYILFLVPDEEDVQAVIAYLNSLKPRPSPFLGPKGELTQAAVRGKNVFDSPKTKCASCHPAPLYTDLRTYNVETRGELSRQDEFDTPTLVELYRTAPYLQDGAAKTLREVLTTYNKGDKHGVTSHLSKQEMDDLVAFLRSL